MKKNSDDSRSEWERTRRLLDGEPAPAVVPASWVKERTDPDSQPAPYLCWEARAEDQMPSRVLGVPDMLEQMPCVYKCYSQRQGGSLYGADLHILLAGKPVMGAAALMYLLDNQHLIPEVWRTQHAIYFWGSIYHNEGERAVTGMAWSPTFGAWTWTCRRFNEQWDHDHVAAVWEYVEP